MADGLNKAMLIGNLGVDPELRATTNGKSKLNIRLATTESYLDSQKQRQEVTHWHNVVLWGARAEALSKILTKGSRIYVEGRIETRSYDDKDGVKKYVTDIVANNIILLGGKPGDGGQRSSGGGKPAPAPRNETVDDFPADTGGGGADDDIPF